MIKRGNTKLPKSVTNQAATMDGGRVGRNRKSRQSIRRHTMFKNKPTLNAFVADLSGADLATKMTVAYAAKCLG